MAALTEQGVSVLRQMFCRAARKCLREVYTHVAGTPASNASRSAIFFHWVIALLIAVAYQAIEIRGSKGSDNRAFWNSIHFTCGLLVMLLAILRVLWRLWCAAPADATDARLLVFFARLAHLLLYGFIFVRRSSES